MSDVRRTFPFPLELQQARRRGGAESAGDCVLCHWVAPRVVFANVPPKRKLRAHRVLRASALEAFRGAVTNLVANDANRGLEDLLSAREEIVERFLEVRRV